MKKNSKQRDLILRLIRSSNLHPTADWVYEQARKEIANISLGTVYRNLHFLKEEGRIQEFLSTQGVLQYDGDLRDHYHVRCCICDRLEDVPHIASRLSIEEVENLTGYQIYSLKLEFLGVCSHCKDTEKRARNIDSGSN